MKKCFYIVGPFLEEGWGPFLQFGVTRWEDNFFFFFLCVEMGMSSFFTLCYWYFTQASNGSWTHNLPSTHLYGRKCHLNWNPLARLIFILFITHIIYSKLHVWKLQTWRKDNMGIFTTRSWNTLWKLET